MTFRIWRWQIFVRVLLAGPIAVLLTLAIVACMPIWFPRGAGGIDNIALPVIMLPGIWAILFFHAVLDRSLARVAVVAVGLAGLNLAMLVWKFSTPA